jgi:hypothetical protein
VNEYERGRCEERREIVARMREIAGVIKSCDNSAAALTIMLTAAVIEAEGDSETVDDAVSRVQEWIT